MRRIALVLTLALAGATLPAAGARSAPTAHLRAAFYPEALGRTATVALGVRGVAASLPRRHAWGREHRDAVPGRGEDIAR